jgi:hypothetical protein
VRKNAKVKVYFAWVGALVPVEMESLAIEVARVRGLPCAVDRQTADRYNKDRPNFVLAPAADSRRWHAATKALLRAIKTVQRRSGRRLLRPNEDTLRDYAHNACRDYREKADDLSWQVKAAQESRMLQMRASREYQQRDREIRDRWDRATEELKQKKRAAMASAPGEPVWSYMLYSSRAGHRCFRIRLPAVDQEVLPHDGFHMAILTRTGLTPEQVQSALAEERSRHGSTTVEWAPDTKSALEEWHESGTVEKAWQALTGELVATDPRPPEERRESQRFYGPSSNYFSPGGFGPHI